MSTNINKIKKEAEALKELMDKYNSFRELHQQALGPHFEPSIFDKWFTQQIMKEGK